MTSALEIFESDKRENYSKVVLHKKLLVTLTNKDDKLQDRNEDSPNSSLDIWRTRQEAERERIRKLDHTPQPPERPPKKLHLRPQSPPSLDPPASSCENMNETISVGSVKDMINIFSPKETNTIETSLTTLKSTFKSSSSFHSSMKSSSSSIEISESTSSLRNYHQKICHNIPKKKPAVAPKPFLSRYSESTPHLNREFKLSTENILQKEKKSSSENNVEKENVPKKEARPIHSFVPDLVPELTPKPILSSCIESTYLRNKEIKVSPENNVETESISEIESKPITSCSPDQLPCLNNPRLEQNNQVNQRPNNPKYDSKNKSRDPNLSSDLADHMDLFGDIDNHGDIDNQSSSPVDREMLELRNKRKELVERMKTNLDLLKSDKEELLVEVEDNTKVGVVILEALSECGGSLSEIDKVNVHITEVDRLTTLLVVLDIRMDRTEKFIRKCSDYKVKELLEKKRTRLISQIQEAKDLKCFRDKRGDVLHKMLQNILSEDLMKKYQTFMINKVSLIQELKKLDDKIEMGEEQLSELRKVNC